MYLIIVLKLRKNGYKIRGVKIVKTLIQKSRFVSDQPDPYTPPTTMISASSSLPDILH